MAPPAAPGPAPGDAFGSPPGQLSDFDEAPPQRDDTAQYFAPGEIQRTGEWTQVPTTKIHEYRRGIAKWSVIVLVVLALGLGVFIFVRTRQRPINTVQNFWFWANHTDVSRMIECWTPDYLKQHPEIQKELEALFDAPSWQENYMGTRVRTNSYDSLTYEFKDNGKSVLATTYAPGELTGKAKGTKDKLTEMTMVKQGSKWYITDIQFFY